MSPKSTNLVLDGYIFSRVNSSMSNSKTKEYTKNGVTNITFLWKTGSTFSSVLQKFSPGQPEVYPHFFHFTHLPEGSPPSVVSQV